MVFYFEEFCVSLCVFVDGVGYSRRFTADQRCTLGAASQVNEVVDSYAHRCWLGQVFVALSQRVGAPMTSLCKQGYETIGVCHVSSAQLEHQGGEFVPIASAL